MEKQVFRQKSVERIASPEQLQDYMRVTNPGIWMVLAAVILLLAGLLVWGSMTYIDSVAYGKAEVSQGSMLVRFDEERAAENVDVGMSVTVGESQSVIRSMGWDEQGMFALAETTLADGEYDAAVHYKQTQVLKLLFR
jgi:hypothetical protein